MQRQSDHLARSSASRAAPSAYDAHAQGVARSAPTPQANERLQRGQVVARPADVPGAVKVVPDRVRDNAWILIAKHQGLLTVERGLAAGV